jgi:Tfp pilus assembly protein PilF
MFPIARNTLILPLIVSLAACATVSSQPEGDKAPYYDSAFNDHNRAPASFAPQALLSDDKATIDALYMRTQADYNFAAAEAYSLEGNSPKAVEMFKLTLVYDPESPLVHMRLATEFLKQGMLTEALSQSEEAVAKDPKNVDARVLLGGLYSSMKIYDKAMVQYQQVLSLDSQNVEAPLYIGALFSEQKQPEKAVQYFESLIKNPNYQTPHMAHYYIGRVRVDQGGEKNYKSAEVALKQSLQVKPDFAEAALALGSLYTKQKKSEKAVELYRNFQKENSPNPKIAEILAQNYIEQGDYESAYDQLEVVEADSDEPLNVRMKMALILIEQKKFTLAAKKLEEILKEAPDSDKVRFYLGAVFEEMRENERAVKEYAKIPSASTYYGEAIVHGSYLLKGLNRMDEAVKMAAKGLEERQDFSQIYAIYASLLDEKGDYRAASKILEKGIEKFPTSAQLRFYYGTVSDRSGQKEVVVREMKKVIEIEPEHVQALNYLAFTWAEMNTNMDEAEALARKALALEPTDGYVLDTLGWILYKKNQTTEAIKYLEAAQRNQSSVSIIAEHLGDAYLKQSLTEKAKQMYLKAADLETDKKKIEEIRSKITAIERQQPVNPRLPASVEESPFAGREQ